LRSGRITSVSPAACAASTFLLQAADWQHAAWSVTSPVMQTVLLTDRPVSSDASAVTIVTPALGAVLRHGAGRHVEVELLAGEGVIGDAQRRGVASHVGQRDACRLLHHVAQLAGEHEAARAGHRGRLDEQHVAATPVTARPVATPGVAVRAATSWKTFWRPSACRTAASSMTTGLAAWRSATDAPSCATASRSRARADGRGLARVLAHDEPEHLVGGRHVVGNEAVALDLPRPEITRAIATFSSNGVAVELDHLHAVEQRTWIRSATLAVAMNSTCDRSISTSR